MDLNSSGKGEGYIDSSLDHIYMLKTRAAIRSVDDVNPTTPVQENQQISAAVYFTGRTISSSC